MIEGGELPCHFEWFVERVGAADHVQVVDAAAVLPQPQALGQEEEVEQATLRGARQTDERVELDLAARLRIGPHRGVVDPGEVRGQVNRLAVLAVSGSAPRMRSPNVHPVSPHRLAISSCERSRSAWRCVTDVMTNSSAEVTR